jgi:hypothetical protein
MSDSFPKGFKFVLNPALTVALGVLSNKVCDALTTSPLKPEVVVHCGSRLLFRA